MSKSEFRPPGSFGDIEGSVESKRPEIKDPAQIEEKIKKAKKRFPAFLMRRISRKADVAFTITVEDMLMNLNISDIPRDRALEELKKLVDATPGLEMNKQGNIVSDPEVLEKTFVIKDVKQDVLKIFADNPDTEFAYQDIMKTLGLRRSKVEEMAKKLVEEKKIYLVRNDPAIWDEYAQRPAGIYKLVKPE